MPRRNRNSDREPVNRDRLIDEAATLARELIPPGPVRVTHKTLPVANRNILIGSIPSGGKSAAFIRYLSRVTQPGDLVWVTDAKQPFPELIPQGGDS